MNQQVIPLLLDFKDILEGNGSIFLNLQNGGGMNFWGVFLFFLSSPFSFLMIWIPKAAIYQAVNLLVMGKMMVCAGTACIFFHKRFEKLNAVQILSLSVLYAFCGYSLFYYQNIVWLDMMYLFPLLLLSLLHMAEKEKIIPYILVFSCMMVVHFYLSYMIVIFLLLSCVLYIYLCVKPERRGRVALLLGMGTAVSFFLTAPVWLPSLLQYAASARTGNLYLNLITGNFLTRLNTTIPLLLCTTAAVLSLFFCFFKGRRWDARRKYLFFLLILLLLPVLVEPINKMWHTGSYQAFPVRYGYITILIGLSLLASLLSENMEAPSVPSSPGFVLFAFAVCGAVPLVASLLLQDSFKEMTVYTRTLWGSDLSFSLLAVFFSAAAAAYFLIFLFFHYRQISVRVFSGLFAVIVLSECAFNSSLYIGSASSSPERYQDVLDLSSRIDSSAPYRVKTQKKYFDVNLIGALGYPSLSHYTSLTGKNFMYTMKKLGYSSYWMEVNSNGGTLFSDWLLGNQYCIKSISDCLPTDTVVYQNSTYALVQTYDSVPFGLTFSSHDIASLQSLTGSTRSENQKYIYETLFPEAISPFRFYLPEDKKNILSGRTDEGKDFYFKLTDENCALEYKISVSGTQRLYFDCFDEPHSYLKEEINGSFNVYVNGVLIQDSYPSQSSNGLLDLGTFTDTTVNILVELNKDMEAYSVGVFGIDETVLSQTFQSASYIQSEISNNRFVFQIQADEEQYLFVPISNDGGYTALVNGQTVPVYTVFDTFLAVPLVKGENSVQISYSPPGFRLGWILSAAGCLLLLCCLWLLKRKPLWLLKIEKPMQILCTGLAVLAFVIVYIFPVCVYISR